MASGAVPAVTQAPTKVQRYLEAERLLWDRYGLTPVDRSVDLASGHLRVQEVGSGEPVLFIHGTGGSGAYFAPLLRSPQPGRSSTMHRKPRSARRGASPYRGRLDRRPLGAPLRDGAPVPRPPDGLAGWGPIAAEVTVPRFIRLLRSPIGQIIIRLPENPGMLRKQLAGLGHATSLGVGRFPEAFADWHVASSRYTDWLTNERDIVRAIVDRNGFVPGLVPDADREIARMATPTLMVFGTADPNGSVDIWHRFIARFPGGELELVESGGHLVWYDDPETVGERVTGFLDG